VTLRKGVAVVVLLSFLSSAAGGAEAQAGKTRLLMLIAEGVNGNEFMVPYEVGRAAGYEFDLAGRAKGTLLGKNAGRGAPAVEVKLLLDDVKDISPHCGYGNGCPDN
jgi:putative intracellular protease/amidase